MPQGGKNERNEYIPSFISKKPFYLDDLPTNDQDYLEHQRLQNAEAEANKNSKWYDRGKRVGPAATKFRKGACENCGAVTHRTKECLSRPRAKGAKWTGKDIQADELVQDVKMGWDAKRDRWNGYDPAEYATVVREYEELESRKKALKGDGEDKKLVEGLDEDDEEDNAGDAKYEAETDMGRKQATSTRNLRLREDTAKYLLNLDLDSAKYDPKTRSMVAVPQGNDNSGLLAEEGFMRTSGDAAEFEKAQKYAWETQERGDKNKIHLQANPTSGEYFRKKERAEGEAKREAQRKLLLDKYGDQPRASNSKDAAVVESDKYVEYDEKGKIKGAPAPEQKSKYPEDILINNHTSVWGSWWSNFRWGYACCYSTVKNSYCTGERGREAFESEKNMKTGTFDSSIATDVEKVPREVAWNEEETREEHVPNGVEYDGKARVDEKARKRTLEKMRDDPGVDNEEMEDYRRKKLAVDDPMKAFLGKDELVR